MDFYQVTFTNKYSQYAKTPAEGINTWYAMTQTDEPYTETMLQTVHPELPLETTRKLIKATKLKGAALNKFLWEEPRWAYHIEAGAHIKLMCKELRKLGFVINDFTTECLTATSSKYNIQVVFTRVRHREVYWKYTPKHPEYTGKDIRFVIGRWMGSNSTTESSLDFNTLKTIYERITHLLAKFDSADLKSQADLVKAFKKAKKTALRGIPHVTKCAYANTNIPINSCPCDCHNLWWFKRGFNKE